MTIQSGDAKLIKSAVMADVPEGGGAPTDNVITDGASNSIFPDISELDRAGGRVSLRKTFVSIQSDDTDTYFGANVIVAEPPTDPLVSVTLFSTESTFDERASAKARIESYMTVGAQMAPYLFGDHIAGQRSITLLGRTSEPTPVVGTTLVMRAQVGASLREQFVRITDVAAIDRTFTHTDGRDFTRRQFTIGISDALRYDFPGQPLAYYTDAQIDYTNRTRLYDTVVADAARYYGVVPLSSPASLGDFTIEAEGIFTQLVPSAQVETPIADARPNQQTGAAIASGDSIVQTLSHAWTRTAAMYVGGGILPGSLTIARAGITLKDSGGKLLNQSDLSQVGTVDYDNGILSLSTDVFGTSGGTHTVTFTPAEKPEVMTRAVGIDVTQATQRLSYALTLTPSPAPGSLDISYRSGGRWYTLKDDGSGKITGSDSSFGAGTLNQTTGTITVTLGALPDVGTKVIVGWAPKGTTQPVSAVIAQTASPLVGRFFFAVRMLQGDGVTPRKLKPGTVSLSWNDGTARTITDNGQGVVSGYGVGKIDYNGGIIRFSPTTLPPKGTTLTVTVIETSTTAATVNSFTDGGSTWNFSLGGLVRATTVELAIAIRYGVRSYPDVDTPTEKIVRVFDDGAGNLVMANISGNLTVGTVNYSTGACTLNKTVGGFKDVQKRWEAISYVAYNQPTWTAFGPETRTLSMTVLNGPTAPINAPAWAWWAGPLATAAQTRAAVADGTSFNTTTPLNALYLQARLNRFTVGADVYTSPGASGVVQRNFSPATGLGTEVGTCGAYTVIEAGYEPAAVPSGWSWGHTMLTEWVAGISPVASSMAGLSSAAIGDDSQAIDRLVFRTAVAPIRNGSFSIVGMTPAGTTFNVTANTTGVISGSGVTGSIDYENGIVEVAFANGALSSELRYNATAYTYLPLDADILGLDPVRLPQDGRVPIFRPGEFAVVGHTGSVSATVSNGQVINCGRVRLSRVRVIGHDGQVINTGYTADLEAGLVTFTNVTGYAQPVTVEHRIEDMAIVRDAQISGQLTFTRALTHNYPAGSYVSSALIAGDLFARVSLVFDQATWSGAWSDAPSGGTATATFNDVTYPITVSNRGALTERWAVRFTNSTAFEVIGENVGVVAIGNTSSNCAPVNPNTGVPYFTIPALGWGSGWSVGNVLRFNTIGAEFPVWVVRTVQQGPATVPDDQFTILIRGDVDTP